MDLSKTLSINSKKMKNIVSSISGTIVDIREISTLDMRDEELAVSLELEAKKHIPLDGTDAIIDYHHLGANNKEIDKINIILTSTTKNIINEHATLIKNAGYKPNIFDSDPIAISNLYKYNYNLSEEGADVILNIGNSSSNIVVWGKNSPFFTRTIDIGGNFFNKEIMKTYKVDYKTAEEMKIKKGIDVFDDGTIKEEKEDLGISIEKKTSFNDLTDDIKRTLRFYMKNNPQSFFNNFYLTGGSSSLPGLDNFIASTLNVKVEKINPIQNIKNSTEVENINQYGTAIGLALRGLEN
jgi:type IV pilus assembly protein PilM